MQWDSSANGGFSSGTPWLPAVDPARVNVADQRDDPASTLSLVRELIAVRRELPEAFELVDAEDGVLAFRRGDWSVAINTTAEPRPAPELGTPRIQTAPGALAGGLLAPHAGVLAMG
jgi:alpha-glucosidase